MNGKLQDLLGKAREIETRLTGSVERAARRVSGAATRQPLEVLHDVLDAVEREVQPGGRDQHLFPFNDVRVTIAAASERDRARFEALCTTPPSLRQRVTERLVSLGCDVPTLDVRVEFTQERAEAWSHQDFDLLCARAPEQPAPEGKSAAPLTLTVIAGTSATPTASFERGPIAIGRGAEVRDQRQRLLRTNHLAFVEGAGVINESVSRRHARIESDPASGTWRIFDDGSAQGTSVIRGGRGHQVPRGSKGLRLQAGDEIVLGQARILVEPV